MGAEVVHAAFEAGFPDASEAVLGDGQVAGLWTAASRDANPALAAGGGWRAGAASTHPYGIDELDLSGFWAGGGARGWLPGWQVRWKALRAGELYREDQVGIDLASGGARWSVGAGWRGGRTELEGRSDGWLHGLAAGVVFVPASRISLGAAWEDVSTISVPDSRWARPWTLRCGASAAGSDSDWVSLAGFEVRQDAPVGWSLGQEWRWGVIVLRAGLGFEPWTMALGAGLRWKGVRFDWARQGEPRLGWQQHWTISVER